MEQGRVSDSQLIGLSILILLKVEATQHWLRSQFCIGRLCPKVQPITLFYTTFTEKVSLLYNFNWKKSPPFTYMHLLYM